MVITHLTGGLGNQIFQYAVGRQIAARYKAPLKLDLSYFEKYKNDDRFRLHRYGLSHFDIPQVFVTKKELLAIKKSHVFMEGQFHYNPIIETVGPDVYLEGYWQSEKYFNTVSLILRKELVFVDRPTNANQRMIDRITACNEPVSIHIRRGDYVTMPHLNKRLGLCPMDYYTRAINLICSNLNSPSFFLFSNDPIWVRKYFPMKYSHTIVDINDEISCYEDMRLMSLCQHHIIANSTFSWWGAWLSTNPRKIVVAPKEWLARPSKEWNPKDVVPEEWHRL